jgi:hypothetical protein
MNQAFKIINKVGLMNQTPSEEMAEKMEPGPNSWEVYARKEKCHCEERSDEAISYYKHVEIATLPPVARDDNFFMRLLRSCRIHNDIQFAMTYNKTTLE